MAAKFRVYGLAPWDHAWDAVECCRAFRCSSLYCYLPGCFEAAVLKLFVTHDLPAVACVECVNDTKFSMY